MKKIITLPLPDAKLSPNARIHWAQKSKITKAHREYAAAESVGVFGKKGSPTQIKSYRLFFFWKDRRRHDRDNASSSCKAYLDGVSDAIGQDDSEWEFDGVRFGIDRDNPRVEIHAEIKTEKTED